MVSETVKVANKYNRLSKFYDFFEGFMEERKFRKWRKEIIPYLKGNILEIGVGTGKNLEFYNVNKITAIDISEGMLKKAKEKSKNLKLSVDFYLMDAQNLEFKNEIFDYVVGTFILCSIPDPVKALSEMKRVLKKDGKIMLIEHVLSRNKFIALWEHIHNPFTKWLFGLNVNRNTKRNIEKAGLKIIKDEKLAFFDVFRRFTCVK